MKKFIKLAALAFTAICTLASCGGEPTVKKEWTEDEKAVFEEHAFGWELPVPNAEGTLEWVPTSITETSASYNNYISYSGSTITDKSLENYKANFTEEKGWTAWDGEVPAGYSAYYGEKTIDDDTWLQALVIFGVDSDKNFEINYYTEHSWQLFENQAALVTECLLVFGVTPEQLEAEEWVAYDETDGSYYSGVAVTFKEGALPTDPDELYNFIYDITYEEYAIYRGNPLKQEGYGAHVVTDFDEATFTLTATGEECPGFVYSLGFGTFSSPLLLDVQAVYIPSKGIYQVIYSVYAL
jgi:hypothetical protein